MWSHDGFICTGEVCKNHVKMTFLKGASLEDPSGLFNAGFEGNAWRPIDIHEGDKVDEADLDEAADLKDLIRAAVALKSPGREQCGAQADAGRATSNLAG